MKLFVISTPAQAFFLSKSKNLIDENSVLLITLTRRSLLKNMLAYLEKFPWKEIIVNDLVGFEKRKGYYKVFLFQTKMRFWLKRKFKQIDRLYIGSYDNQFHLGLAGLLENKAEIYLLYDGLQMTRVCEDRKASVPKSIKGFSKLFRWANFKVPKLRTITFISPFHLNVPAFDKLIKIEFSHLPKPRLIENMVYFAGQPFIDEGTLSEGSYLSKLHYVQSFFGDKKIVYVPHPKESAHSVGLVREHFEIVRFDNILEEVFLNSKEFPKTVASFNSSILINLTYLSEEVELFAVEIHAKELTRPAYIKSFPMAYAYFRSMAPDRLKVLDPSRKSFQLFN